MRDYDIDYFIEKEESGVIFAKITKRDNDNNIHGGYFCYFNWIGKVLDCNENHFECGTTTIEPLEVALGYFHYGDQIAILSFTNLKKELNDIKFAGYDNGKKNCYEVNAIYVQNVLPMNKKSTIDYLMQNVSKEYWMDYSYKMAAQHLRERGEDNLTDYFVESICNVINGDKQDDIQDKDKNEENKIQHSFLKKLFSKNQV